MYPISKTFSLPEDAPGRTIAWLCQKGGGKTYAAKRLTELFRDQQVQVVALDPTGVWWGLRSSADGKSPGLSILIMGGEHGDVPLEPTAGEIVARFIVTTGRSVVLDLSGFESNAAQDRFAADFGEALFRMKASARSPLHLMMDEADSFAPQRPMPGQQRMLGAYERIVKQGRSRGIGISLISQRPAVINKNVLSQVDALLCGRITGPHDHKAVEEWTNLAGTTARKKDFLARIPKLQTGQFWLWSPSWLDAFQGITVSALETYDSSNTPVGAARAGTTDKVALAQVDLSTLTEEIRASAAHAGENDPKRLRAEIARLQRDLAGFIPEHTLTDDDREKLERFTAALEVATGLFTSDGIANIIAKVHASMGAPAFIKRPCGRLPDFSKELLEGVLPAETVIDAVREHSVRVMKLREPSAISDAEIERRERRVAEIRGIGDPLLARAVLDGTDTKLTKCGRAIMTVLAQNRAACTKRKIALCSRYSATSSSFEKTMSQLRANGYIVSHGPMVQATDKGRAALGDFEPLPDGGEAVRYWIGALPKCEGEILTVLLHAGGSFLTKEEIASFTASRYSVTSSSFEKALSQLRTRELITRGTQISLILP